MKNRSKSIDEVQQTRKVSSSPTHGGARENVSVEVSLYFNLQAFSTQKSLPGRSDMDQVKVSTKIYI